MKQITEIRCSGLSRPMTCSGSLFFENLPQQESNEAAKEGTACGEYLALLLTKPGQIYPTHASNGVPFDDDMKFYSDEVSKNILTFSATEILCEQRIDWQTRSGIVIKGSYDISYVDKDGNLRIDDLKYGWGIVDVFENWQLLGYAIGEVIRRQSAFPKIIMRILQPRPHHEDGPYREWTVNYEELLGYKERIEARLDKIAGGFAELVTSAKCKYCPAAPAACTAFNRAVFHGVDYVLTHHQQDDINEKEISFQLDLLGRVSEVLKIKSESLKALAVDRIKNGVIIPNYMSEQSFGDRKWKKDISPEVIETLTGIKIVETVMLSPAKAEKLGVSKELVKSYVDRFFLGNKLVRKDAGAMADKIFNNKGL